MAFRIRELIVSPQQEQHVWSKHRVTLGEVEYLCLSQPYVLRGRDRSYAVYGQTAGGRYLTVFLFPRGRGVYSLATAREMNDAERRRYRSFRGR